MFSATLQRNLEWSERCFVVSMNIASNWMRRALRTKTSASALGQCSDAAVVRFTNTRRLQLLGVFCMLYHLARFDMPALPKMRLIATKTKQLQGDTA